MMRHTCGAVFLALSLAPVALSCTGDDAPSMHPAVDAGPEAPDTQEGSKGPRQPPPEGFAPFPGLDLPAHGRRLGDAGESLARDLQAHSDGTSWLLWSESTDRHRTAEYHLDQFDEDGKLLRSSALAMSEARGLALDAEGRPIVWRNGCGADRGEICLYREGNDGAPVESKLELERQHTTYRLDWSGNIVGVTQGASTGGLQSLVTRGERAYALSGAPGYRLQGLRSDLLRATWAVRLMPIVEPPESPFDDFEAIPDERLGEAFEWSRRQRDLAAQTATPLAAVDDGVVVAFAASRGAIAALNAEHGLTLPVPAESSCADIVVVHASTDGRQLLWAVAPTAVCELLPKLAMVGHHAVVVSTISSPKPPEENDTAQIDIGLSIVDLTTGAARSRLIAFHEDDWAEAVSPCGDHACIAGVTGARSVNTGSTVTFGEGFILPISVDGELGTRISVKSDRHSVVHALAAGPRSLVFFATLNGPITHTADEDPTLAYRHGLLGRIPLPVPF